MWLSPVRSTGHVQLLGHVLWAPMSVYSTGRPGDHLLSPESERKVWWGERPTSSAPVSACTSHTKNIYISSCKTNIFRMYCWGKLYTFNPLTPNDPYRGRTAPLTSKRCILYIYSTNTVTEYFEHGIYSSFFFSSKCNLFHNYNVFGSCIIHILYTRVC